MGGKSRPEVQRAWLERNAERLREQRRLRYRKNREVEVEARRKYRREHPERIYQTKRKQYLKHKEKQDRENSEWKKRNRDRVNAWQKNWRAKDPVRANFIFAKHGLRRRSASGSHSLEQWISRIEFYGWRCVYCGGELTPSTVRQDHILPLSKGGTNWASNLAPACQSCNSKKRDKKPWVFGHPKHFVKRG